MTGDWRQVTGYLLRVRAESARPLDADIAVRYRAGADYPGADRHHGDVCWLCAVWRSWSAHRDGQCLSPFFPSRGWSDTKF